MARKSLEAIARHAGRSLATVKPSEIAAAREVEPEVLAALLRRVTLAARGTVRADEVEAVASLRAPALYIGAPEERRDVDAIARAAVRLASATVRAAYRATDSLDSWAEVWGDMLETVAATGTDRADMPHAWCPRPDARYATTDADVVAACHAALAGTPHAQVFRDAARAYMAHPDRRCATCERAAVEGTGRRVTLAGILAHTRGLTTSDAQFHAIRRAVLRAVEAVRESDVRAEHYYPHAEGGRPSHVHLERPDRLTAPGVRERERRGLPDTDAVTVRRADGTGYRTTQARIDERAAKRAPEETSDRLRALAPEVRADVLAERLAGAPSRAVRRTERRRGNGGAGAYGSQVGARPSGGARATYAPTAGTYPRKSGGC